MLGRPCKESNRNPFSWGQKPCSIWGMCLYLHRLTKTHTFEAAFLLPCFLFSCWLHPSPMEKQTSLAFISSLWPANSSLEPPLGDGVLEVFITRQVKALVGKQRPFHLVYVAGSSRCHHLYWSLKSSVALFCVNPLRPRWPLGDLTPTLRHTELEIITPIWEKNTPASRAYQALFFLWRLRKECVLEAILSDYGYFHRGSIFNKG